MCVVLMADAVVGVFMYVCSGDGWCSCMGVHVHLLREAETLWNLQTITADAVKALFACCVAHSHDLWVIRYWTCMSVFKFWGAGLGVTVASFSLYASIDSINKCVNLFHKENYTFFIMWHLVFRQYHGKIINESFSNCSLPLKYISITDKKNICQFFLL